MGVDTLMNNQKTPEQWIDYINRSQSIEGSNIDCCKKHNIAVKMIYKKRVQCAAEKLEKDLVCKPCNGDFGTL